MCCILEQFKVLAIKTTNWPPNATDHKMSTNCRNFHLAFACRGRYTSHLYTASEFGPFADRRRSFLRVSSSHSHQPAPRPHEFISRDGLAKAHSKSTFRRHGAESFRKAIQESLIEVKKLCKADSVLGETGKRLEFNRTETFQLGGVRCLLSSSRFSFFQGTAHSLVA